MYKKLFIFFYSQFMFLGVFWAEYTAQIALNDELNLCGSFTRGTTENPNWLPEGWKVTKGQEEAESIEDYCIESSYRYAGVPIGEELEECRYIFADVEGDWGCKYIEAALENWYIAWNEWFRPNDTVSKSEALKLIFKARWIEKRYDTRNWQEDYISSAYYLWYIENKPETHTENATRWWIFSALAKSYDDFEN